MIEGEYPLAKGDIVVHVRDPLLRGVVKYIDTDLAYPTICSVVWDGYEFPDITWTNKLIKITDHS